MREVTGAHHRRPPVLDFVMPSPQLGRRTAEYPGRAAAVGALCAAIGVAIAWALPAASVSPMGPEVSWVLLALLFGVAEVCVLHVQMRGGARTVSLSEAPLVLGLFFTTPSGLVLARLLGPLVVFVVIRRQALVKVGVNAAVLLVEVGLAVALFRLVLAGAAPTSQRAWLAAYVAVLVSGVVAGVVVTLIIAIFQNEFHRRDLYRAVTTSSVVSLVVGTLALVAVNALQRSPETGWLLVGAAVVILTCYRAYAALTGRHAALGRLYRFTDAISSTHEPDEVLRQLLLSAREIAAAEHAEVVFAPALPEGRPTRLTIDQNGHLQRSDAGQGDLDHDVPDPVHAYVLRTGEAILLPYRSGLGRRPEWRRYLKRVGRRETLAVPLRDAQPRDEARLPVEAATAVVSGSLMVAGRVGQVRTFDAADLRLVETVANHAALALRNGWLINGLTHAVRHDGLTGLVNRSWLHQQLSDVLAEIREGRREGAAVMICDLNGFKDVNDALGHQMGDVLLQEVAVRASAALSPGDVLARLGGDEFAILLPNAVTADEATEVGERVLSAIAEPVALADLVISIGMSIGVALAPRHGVETSGLLKRADMAMYAAKATNRGLRVWEPGMGQSDAQQLTFAGELRRALAADEITVYAQPIASLVTGEITAVEILPRWQHPDRGMLLPEEFVPTATTSGLASELARHVLAAAIDACASWRDAGFDIGVSVDMPARSLTDATLPDAISRLLEARQLSTDRLTLEIAEASVMHEQSRTLPGLRQLAALGLRVAVDGFGTSHSSLSYLRRMPIRQVKIDASFIRRIDHDSSDEAVVRSIVDLGAKLGLDVVAEGVDRQITWDHLRRMGCAQAQGNLLARPMPLPQLDSWLQDDDPALRRLLTGAQLNVNAQRSSVDVGTGDPLRGQAS